MTVEATRENAKRVGRRQIVKATVMALVRGRRGRKEKRGKRKREKQNERTFVSFGRRADSALSLLTDALSSWYAMLCRRFSWSMTKGKTNENCVSGKCVC